MEDKGKRDVAAVATEAMVEPDRRTLQQRKLPQLRASVGLHPCQSDAALFSLLYSVTSETIARLTLRLKLSRSWKNGMTYALKRHQSALFVCLTVPQLVTL